ncbi:MAG: hypothetical protein IKU81_07065 [Oscillibacter sp.]|nr:hypothetical protein [Oscillibacter sp.]
MTYIADYYRSINSSKKKAYDCYEKLPKTTKKVYESLVDMFRSQKYLDDNLKFAPSNAEIASEAMVNFTTISHHLAVLDKNGYIWVTTCYDADCNIRRRRIDMLKIENNDTKEKNKNAI